MQLTLRQGVRWRRWANWSEGLAEPASSDVLLALIDLSGAVTVLNDAGVDVAALRAELGA